MSSSEQISKAGKKPGLEIWRIENIEMVPVPPSKYGQFFVGDSYIVLHTQATRGSQFVWNLHFWLGNESSQDEKGAAAILSIQLDDHLGGSPIQYRELQNKESATFRGYFKNGITYKMGGIQSGFKQVSTNISNAKRLLHVKGRRSVRATEVEMNWNRFNQGDIFIAEIGNDIFQWNGSKSNRYERLKACELVNSIRDNEKGGKGKIYLINEGDHIPLKMKNALAGTPSDVGPEICDDEEVKYKIRARLYHVSSDIGKLVIKEIATAPFKQDMLNSGDCHIVDDGVNGNIYVWKGRNASKEERTGAMQNAIRFIEERGYHSSTKIQVMSETAESVLFTQFFTDWRRRESTVGFGEVYRFERIAKADQTKFDVKSLHNIPGKPTQECEPLFDGRSGKVEVWRIEGNRLISVDEESIGHFYAGDSYVILFTYQPKGRIQYFLYTWQGLDSTKDEIAASAYHSVLLHEKYEWQTIQCRIVQGKEPRHFLNIFAHPIIISYGGYDKNAGKIIVCSKTNLYQVRSTVAGGTKLIEVELSSKMLNSNDVFLLNTSSRGFIWIGKGSNKVELDAALYGAKKLKIEENLIQFEEGFEPDEFWFILGDKMVYASSPRLQSDMELNPPKLFVISNARGRMFVEEVPGNFTQSDLEPDDIMMLDVFDEVFIWIGEGANSEERKEAPKIVDDYIACDPTGRDPNCPVITINMGFEPVNFTGYFPSWDTQFFEKKKQLAEAYKNL